MNNDGTCYRDGERIEAENMIGIEPLEYYRIEAYLLSLEKRLWTCLKYKKKYCK